MRRFGDIRILKLPFKTSLLIWNKPFALFHAEQRSYDRAFYVAFVQWALCCFLAFLDPEGGSQKVTLVVVVLLVVISSRKIPKAFRNTQCSATKLCTHIRAHIPYRSAVSYF